MEASFIEDTNKLLAELVQNKCVNPPGNEMKSIKTIEKLLNERGIESKIYEKIKDRGNLIARIKGTDKNAPGLIFGPSHVDVVPVTKLDKWDVDPFEGVIKDEYIWGRGTLDMLFIVASQVQAFIKLHEEGFKPKGDLILFIVADEERGGSAGAEWIVENFPENLGFLDRKMYAVTEAGGVQISKGKYVIITGEKGVNWTKLKFKGKPGHGSTPYGSDNAIHKVSKAALLITKYCDKKIPLDTSYLKELVNGLGLNFLLKFMITNKRLLPIMLKLMKLTKNEMGKTIHSLSRMTMSPNVVKGGKSTNIIASEAELEIDIRTLPGQDFEYVVHHIKKSLKKLSKEVEISKIETEESISSLGTSSPPMSDFVEAMRKAIEAEVGEAKIVPLIASGATDARFLRKKNVDAYGFSLFDPNTSIKEVTDLSHGVNEKIKLKTVELTLKAHYNLAKEFLK